MIMLANNYPKFNSHIYIYINTYQSNNAIYLVNHEKIRRSVLGFVVDKVRSVVDKDGSKNSQK